MSTGRPCKFGKDHVNEFCKAYNCGYQKGSEPVGIAGVLLVDATTEQIQEALHAKKTIKRLADMKSFKKDFDKHVEDINRRIEQVKTLGQAEEMAIALNEINSALSEELKNLS
jgi:hypothetical protein